jgi:alpha-L-rhamnosidase
MVTKLMDNARWSLYGNLIGIPLDCPQRFERLGWLGDAQSFSPTMIYNMDMAGFFTKWLADIRDEQNAQGMYPDFAPVRPEERPNYWGAPAWSDGGVIVPWQAWLHYADRRMIEEHYDSMRRFVDGMVERDPNLLRLSGRGNNWGDWMCPPRGAMPKASFGSAFFAHSVDLLGRMAAALDREDDARKYRDLFQRTKAAFVTAYVKPDGTVDGDCQSSYALALHFDLLPDELRPKAVARLLDCIQKADDHVTTGIHTSNRLMLELTAAGRTEAAYRLLNQTTAPSWGRMIDQDATTIWESWYTYDKSKGIKAGGGNSLNHYGLGSVGEWMWRTIVGINPDPTRPGYRHVVIQPEPGGGLTWAKGRYDSIRGPIQCEWAIDQGALQIKVVVPPNMTATVRVPRAEGATVTEGGKPADRALGVKPGVERPSAALFEIGSGEYSFSVNAPTNL